ncbi:ATP-dependent helicase, partial [Geopseudomonas aromaticivorans]
MHWLDGLDEEQRAAASHRGRHALVSAGPGSGKTRMLLAYVLGLLEDLNANPDHILGLAFNKTAAAEFNTRLKALGGKNASRVQFGTIHSFCKEVLEVAAEEGLMLSAELVPEEAKVRALGRQAMAIPGQSIWDVDELKLDLLIQSVSLAKSRLMTLDETTDMGELIKLAEGDEEVARGVLRFEEIRAEHNLRTFDDLIYDLAMAIQSRPEIGGWMTNRYDHVVVDEYQDVDDAQQIIIRTAAGSRAKVFVVGDEDQCIYGWRGANLNYMLHGFEDSYGTENVERYQLSKTYRYGHEVAVAANSVIRHNTERPEKLCISAETTPKTRVEVRMAAKPSQDRYWYKAILDGLSDWTASGRKLSEAAVLMRTYDAAAPLEMALIRQRIPYILDGRGVLEMPEVKGMVAYAILSDRDQWDMLDPQGKQEVWESVLSQPFMYVPKAFVKKVADVLATQDPAVATGALRRMANTEGLRPYQIGSLRKRADLIDTLTAQPRPMKEIAKLIWDRLDWEADVKRRITDPLKQSDRIDALNLMVGELSRYDSVESLMDAIMDRQEQKEEPDFHDCLRITSLHKAKGQEFPLVFIPGLTEGQFPHQMPDVPTDMEAERRLFYVGMTRAMESLILIAPNDSTLAKAWNIPMENGVYRTPEEAEGVTSRFLTEIDPSAIRAARTWFYGLGDHPVTEDLVAYAEKAGKPLPSHYTESRRLLTDQPLVDKGPELVIPDFDFGFSSLSYG